MSRSLKGTKTAVALPHRSESTPRVHRRVVCFWIDGVACVMAEVLNVLQEHTEVRGASSRGFVQRIGKNFFSSEVQHRCH